MNKRRNAVKIMFSLIKLVIPLTHIMLIAIILGVLGYICAIFLTIVAAQIINTIIFPANSIFKLNTLIMIMITIAVFRSILHYIEQYCNHFIAFKLLAMLRHIVFTKLRELCPAKLENKDKGNLIALITTDIELLEVFYAHTISPIVIAIITSAVMTIFISHFSIYASIIILFGYFIVGVVIPIFNGKRGSKYGMIFRNKFGDLNSVILDSLRGIDEIIQYDLGNSEISKISNLSDILSTHQGKLTIFESWQRSLSNITIYLTTLAVLLVTAIQYINGSIDFTGVLICTISAIGSFAPVIAISSLSNNLNQTLASGDRLLNLLEETPVVLENNHNENFPSIIDSSIYIDSIDFSYDEEKIIDKLSLKIPNSKIFGIYGKSGCGKSTLLKLIMRFWDINSGNINIDKNNIQNIPTDILRDIESYVTQETYIFNDTIANNISLWNKNITLDEIIKAAKKASIHNFIKSLPYGYDTLVGELGENLSGGEKQRIGLARAFLHKSPIILLDEPTSNLDALNEGIILKSLRNEKNNKTIILVSHKKSTLNIADNIFKMVSKRSS